MTCFLGFRSLPLLCLLERSKVAILRGQHLESRAILILPIRNLISDLPAHVFWADVIESFVVSNYSHHQSNFVLNFRHQLPLFWLVFTLLFVFSSPSVNAEMIADPDLCDATIAALQKQWDDSHGELPVDEKEMKAYQKRVDFARIHRDLFEKAVSFYEAQTLARLVGRAKELLKISKVRELTQQDQFDSCPAEPAAFFDSATPEFAGQKDAVVVYSYFRVEGDNVRFRSAIGIGKTNESGEYWHRPDGPSEVPLIIDGSPVLRPPTASVRAGWVSDLIRRYVGLKPKNYPDSRDFITAELEKKNLYCPQYTLVGSLQRKRQDALATKSSCFDGANKDLHENESILHIREMPRNLDLDYSARSSKAAI